MTEPKANAVGSMNKADRLYPFVNGLVFCAVGRWVTPLLQKTMSGDIITRRGVRP